MTYVELTDNELLRSVIAALRRIEASLQLPAPQVYVEPPDLTDIVTAVNALNGTGPTADDIASAIASLLQGPPPDSTEALERVARNLDRLADMLKGVANSSGGGGGTVYLSPTDLAQLRPRRAATTTTVALPASTSCTVLSAANDNRVAVVVLNDDTSDDMHMKIGPDCSADSYTLILGPGDFWEPSTQGVYFGPITAAWVTAAAGRAMVTESFA